MFSYAVRSSVRVKVTFITTQGGKVAEQLSEFLANDQREAQILFYVFISSYNHHQERQIVSIQPLVTVILCWWPRCVQVGRRPIR